MKKITKVISLTAAACLALTSFAGCGSKEEANSIPTLNWYMFFPDQDDLPAVVEEVNKITEKEIGCHINIVRIEGGDYNEKIKLALASGEQVDICHMAPSFGFYSHVAKGAFLELDDLIDEYAPEIYNIMPEKFWDAPKIDGKIYGIPNYQIVGRQNGFIVQQELLDKYNFDLDAVTKLEDIEPLYEQIVANENANMICFGNDGGGYKSALQHYVGFDAIGSNTYPCVVRVNDDSLTVVNQYETEEYMNFCKTMRGWYEKGYIAKAGSNSNLSDLRQQGMVASIVENCAPGFGPAYDVAFGNRKTKMNIFDPPFINTANIIATMNCIGATTEHPDMCIKFLDLVNRDVDGIYNLLCYGIEGKHYNKVADNRIEKIKDSGYDPNVSWEFGNNFNAYLYGDQDEDLWEQTAQINETGDVSKLLGFSFNTEPIETELSSCQSIVGEYLWTVTSGSVDPEVAIPEFNAKLKASGVDKIIAEAQKQIDEWKKTQK